MDGSTDGSGGQLITDVIKARKAELEKLRAKAKNKIIASPHTSSLLRRSHEASTHMRHSYGSDASFSSVTSALEDADEAMSSPHHLHISELDRKRIEILQIMNPSLETPRSAQRSHRRSISDSHHSMKKLDYDAISANELLIDQVASVSNDQQSATAALNDSLRELAREREQAELNLSRVTRDIYHKVETVKSEQEGMVSAMKSTTLAMSQLAQTCEAKEEQGALVTKAILEKVACVAKDQESITHDVFQKVESVSREQGTTASALKSATSALAELAHGHGRVERKMSEVESLFGKVASMAQEQVSTSSALTQLAEVQRTVGQSLTMLTKGQEADSLALAQLKAQNESLSKSISEQQQALLQTIRDDAQAAHALMEQNMQQRMQDMDRVVSSKLKHIQHEHQYEGSPEDSSNTFLLVCSLIAALMLACGCAGQGAIATSTY